MFLHAPPPSPPGWDDLYVDNGGPFIVHPLQFKNSKAAFTVMSKFWKYPRASWSLASGPPRDFSPERGKFPNLFLMDIISWYGSVWALLHKNVIMDKTIHYHMWGNQTLPHISVPPPFRFSARHKIWPLLQLSCAVVLTVIVQTSKIWRLEPFPAWAERQDKPILT